MCICIKYFIFKEFRKIDFVFSGLLPAKENNAKSSFSCKYFSEILVILGGMDMIIETFLMKNKEIPIVFRTFRWGLTPKKKFKLPKGNENCPLPP